MRGGGVDDKEMLMSVSSRSSHNSVPSDEWSLALAWGDGKY